MGEVYSHLSEEERQVIQIEVGNGASIRGIGAMLGRSPSSISREIKRNTWFPSNENESYRPYRPKRLKAGPWTGRYYIAGPAQRKADRRRSKPRKPYRLSHDRLWAQVAEWLGRGWSPLPVSGRPRVLWPDDALMRVCPETIYRWVYSSRPLRERWARWFREGTGGAAGTAAGGRRASRSPAECPSPNARRRPTAGARSAIGRPTASSEWDATCTPRWRGGPGSSWPASFRTRPPARASGRSWTCSRRCRPARASASRTTTAPSSPTTKGCATGWAWPRTSPTRTPAGGGEATRTATA